MSSKKNKDIQFKSPLAELMKNMIQEKRACGRKYIEAPRIFEEFDQFLCKTNLKKIELSKETISDWLIKKSCEEASTYQRRIGLVRQLGEFMIRQGYSAYVIPKCFGPPRPLKFIPYVFNHKEIRDIIHAADQIEPIASSPLRHFIMPEFFRLLYGCGFRLSEVLNLRVSDVDLSKGVITVRQGKFNKDRLVPPSVDIIKRLRIYEENITKNSMEKRNNSSFFFPSPKKDSFSPTTIYSIFRKLLYQCNISHGGRGKGPRVHDIRHTFAVHRLIQWHEEGADLNAKMPFLVAYLGHKDFTGTQKYLHLTAELFPNLVSRMNNKFGDIIPGRQKS